MDGIKIRFCKRVINHLTLTALLITCLHVFCITFSSVFVVLRSLFSFTLPPNHPSEDCQSQIIADNVVFPNSLLNHALPLSCCPYNIISVRKQNSHLQLQLQVHPLQKPLEPYTILSLSSTLIEFELHCCLDVLFTTPHNSLVCKMTSNCIYLL